MMPTWCTGSSHSAQHFPVPEGLLQDTRLQPYVHDCQITVHEGQHTYRFCIFFKCHCCLQPNPLLSAVGSQFRGDAVVMRLGGTSSVINMQGRDVAVADYMMLLYMQCSGGSDNYWHWLQLCSSYQWACQGKGTTSKFPHLREAYEPTCAILESCSCVAM